MAQQVKVLALSLLWLWLQLWHKLNPWPEKFHKPCTWPKKKKKGKPKARIRSCLFKSHLPLCTCKNLIILKLACQYLFEY